MHSCILNMSLTKEIAFTVVCENLIVCEVIVYFYSYM